MYSLLAEDRRRRPNFESQSYMPPHSQSSFHPDFPPTMNSTRRSELGRGPRRPSSKEMGEMLDGFMGYLANKSLSSTPPAPGSLPPSMINYRPPTQSSSDANARRRNVDRTSPNSVINHELEHQPLSSQDPQSHESDVMKDSWMTLGSGSSTIPPSHSLQYFYDRYRNDGNIDSSTLMAPVTQTQASGTTAPTLGNMNIFQYPEYNVSDQYFANNLNFVQFQVAPPPALSRSMMDPTLDMGLFVEGSLDENWVTFLREYYGTAENGIGAHQS